MQPTVKSISKHLNISVFMVIFLFHFKGYSQTTPIPDSNFEEALVNMNIDTNGLNGNILNCDALNIYSLNISYQYIDDLSGIEAFTDLKMLNCSNNQISSLDISQNMLLEEIIASDNFLSSINVSQNSKLKKINLSSNEINDIDVSNNIILEDLSISLNNLTGLDVSTNSSLKYLSCYSNLIEDINLLNNSHLKTLYIDFNNLTELNLSQNDDLRTLTCSTNNLNELLVQSNTELNYLDCRNNNITNLQISTNSDLKRLFVSNNNLNEIDLSNAPELILFYGRYNNLTDLDISGNPLLKWIRCEGNNLSSVDFRNGNNSNITEFVMTQNTSLNCIFVDDAQASFLQNWDIDDSSAFVENESECEALSIQEETVFNFNMYPNPTSGNVSITISSQEAKLDIYSVKGQLVYNGILAYGTNNISLSGISSGLYVVKITSEKTSETKKLLLK
jgi:Leucine-rich repeat (LRR) protein